MKVYLRRQKTSVDAVAEYDPTSKGITVLNGSKLSATIAHTEKFRGAKSIEKSRTGIVKDNTLLKDISFKSASTAANFVTGSSTNGLIAWKDADGKTIKQILAALDDGGVQNE